jgi:two-component system cell cycle sensor histidine kinase/response regulator CckA
VWGNETILLVDDDEGVRHRASLMLETAGYKVFSAASGEEALDVLAKLEIRPAMLITDIDMPGMNGMQLAVAVSTSVPGMAVLYVSGVGSRDVASFGKTNDQVEFLRKPFTATLLLRKVREMLDQPDAGRM